MYFVRNFLTISRNIVIPFQRLNNTNKYTFYQSRCSFSLQREEDPDQIVEEICKGDNELEKKLRILMLEVEVMRQDGRFAPDHVRSDQWAHLVELQSKSQRANYLKYLFKTEKAKENFKLITKFTKLGEALKEYLPALQD